MKEKTFKLSLASIAVIFTVIFCVLVIPPLIDQWDILTAMAGGFVNPYASAYSMDAICCWVILLLWVIYEFPHIKHGWICVLLGLVPGVAVGLATYLIIRTSQLNLMSKMPHQLR